MRSTPASRVSVSSLARTSDIRAEQALSENAAGASCSIGRGSARSEATTASSSATQAGDTGIVQRSAEMLARVQAFGRSISTGGRSSESWSTRIADPLASKWGASIASPAGAAARPSTSAGPRAARARSPQQLQVLDGRQPQRDLLAAQRLERLARRRPPERHDLVPVDLGILARRRLRREEARVEAERLLLGGDPVREVGQSLGGQREALLAKHGEEGGVGLLAGRAVGREARVVLRREPHEAAAGVVGQQDADFLEGLADG